MTDALILAGGSGTRLWPASLPDGPKQFLDFGEGSLLSLTVTRAAEAVDGIILIVTASDQRSAVRDDLRDHPAASRVHVLGEPVGRNTLPAIALGVRYLDTVHEGAPSCVAVMPADHRIADTEAFSSDIATAVSAAREGAIVTFGIVPTYAATGYGYIEVSQEEVFKADVSSQPPPDAPESRRALPVVAFREKPGSATAEEYAASGRHFWNSGLFVFERDTFNEELSRYAPDTADGIAALGNINLQNEIPVEAYAALPAESIDYGIMEHTSRATVIQAGFDWTDIGSWDELAALGLPEAGEGGLIADVESENNYVFSDLPVALCGVEGLNVVVKNGVVLVCRRGRSQLVREAARRAESGRQEARV